MATTLKNVSDRELTYEDIVAQLRAEIGGTPFKGNVSAFAREVGINRTQLLKYLDGGVDMGTMRLLQMIRTLGISEAVFFSRARERAGLEPKGD